MMIRRVFLNWGSIHLIELCTICYERCYTKTLYNCSRTYLTFKTKLKLLKRWTAPLKQQGDCFPADVFTRWYLVNILWLRHKKKTNPKLQIFYFVDGGGLSSDPFVEFLEGSFLRSVQPEKPLCPQTGSCWFLMHLKLWSPPRHLPLLAGENDKEPQEKTKVTSLRTNKDEKELQVSSGRFPQSQHHDGLLFRIMCSPAGSLRGK